MGISWENLFSGAKDAVSNALADVSKTAVPALEGSLEQWGINVLTDMKKESDKKLEAGIKEIVERPVVEGSFGAILSETLQKPVFKLYGPYIIGGVLAVGLIGFYLRGK